METGPEKVAFYHDTVLCAMEDLRRDVDRAEPLIPAALLTYPTYDQLLFSV